MICSTLPDGHSEPGDDELMVAALRRSSSCFASPASESGCESGSLV